MPNNLSNVGLSEVGHPRTVASIGHPLLAPEPNSNVGQRLEGAPKVFRFFNLDDSQRLLLKSFRDCEVVPSGSKFRIQKQVLNGNSHLSGSQVAVSIQHLFIGVCNLGTASPCPKPCLVSEAHHLQASLDMLKASKLSDSSIYSSTLWKLKFGKREISEGPSRNWGSVQNLIDLRIRSFPDGQIQTNGALMARRYQRCAFHHFLTMTSSPEHDRV